MLRWYLVLIALLTGLVTYIDTSVPIEFITDPELPHILPQPEISLEDPAVTPHCVEPNPEADLPALNDYARESLADYLNAGGGIERLRDALPDYAMGQIPQVSQLTVVDITGDGEPEIFLAMTDGYPMPGGYGDSYMTMVFCEDGAYSANPLFIRAGAGSRGEGLYAGGGVRLLHIGDLNANGLPDLLYGVGWEIMGSDDPIVFSEYTLMDYDPDSGKFTELFPPVPEDAYRVYTTVTGKEVAAEIIDLDEDGIQEIIINKTIYRWNGKVFAPPDESE